MQLTLRDVRYCKRCLEPEDVCPGHEGDGVLAVVDGEVAEKVQARINFLCATVERLQSENTALRRQLELQQRSSE